MNNDLITYFCDRVFSELIHGVIDHNSTVHATEDKVEYYYVARVLKESNVVIIPYEEFKKYDSLVDMYDMILTKINTTLFQQQETTKEDIDRFIELFV